MNPLAIYQAALDTVSDAIMAGDFAVPSRWARQVIVLRHGRWLFSETQYPITASSWPMTDAALFADPVRQSSQEARK